jgi:hypothetical protein
MLLGRGEEYAAQGGLYYAGQIHDPYDSAALAPPDGPLTIARLALVTALEAGNVPAALRTHPAPSSRAVLVASHTEVVQNNPAGLADLTTALARAGLDVDTVPYGQALTAADLEAAGLVIVLPVLDYPAPEWNVTTYDEGWSEAEVAALEEYVRQGGFLVLTNSAQHRDFSTRIIAANEDWSDMNALAGRFGITYGEPFLAGPAARTAVEHPLLAGIAELQMIPGNGVGLTTTTGIVLAAADEGPAAVLVPVGSAGGQVLALADAGMLAVGWQGANLLFWERLGTLSRDR